MQAVGGIALGNQTLGARKKLPAVTGYACATTVLRGEQWGEGQSEPSLPIQLRIALTFRSIV